MLDMPCSLSLADLNALLDFCKARSFPAFRAKQIAQWLFVRHCADPAQMDNLPLAVRTALASDFVPAQLKAVESRTDDSGTEKYLLQFADETRVEVVIIPGHPDRKTFCLSSQVGCPVRCRFCASGQGGLVRNLRAGEIVDAFLLLCRAINGVPDNIVFMGMGEPLLNFDAVSEAILRLTAEDGYRFSPRRITVSTSGISRGIYALAELDKPLYLALSLHATRDDIRAQIIPDVFREPIADLIRACETFLQTHNRLITLEYTLIDGLNDGEVHARELAQIASKLRAKVNLLACNLVAGAPFKAPSRNRQMFFFQTLSRLYPQVTFRQSKGGTVNAACGQLRARYEAEHQDG